MLFITAIRHLPTAWNLEQKLQGLRDIDIIQPIDKEDRDIIAQRKKYFKKIDHPIKSVYVSELKRTQQSANQYGFLTPTVSPLLNELDFGKYEGLSRAQLMDELEPRWTKNPLSLQLGESLQNLQQRVFDFLNLLEEQSHTLLFCHGNWMRALK